MAKISECEFKNLCLEIYNDQDTIIRHNPIGTREETLLWMLMSCLISYLSLENHETPCFSGKPNQETYRNAILFILNSRKLDDFDATPYLDKLLEQ